MPLEASRLSLPSLFLVVIEAMQDKRFGRNLAVSPASRRFSKANCE
jgi:hypothetical protein